MADNYIEKRMAEIAAGRTSAAPSSRYPGIDVLFGRVANNSSALDSFDPDYNVHPLQIQAIINSINRLQRLPLHDLSTPLAESSERIAPDYSLEAVVPGSDKISGGQGDSGDGLHPGIIIKVGQGTDPERVAFIAGILAQSIILKAAEMGLAALAVDNLFIAIGRIKSL